MPSQREFQFERENARLWDTESNFSESEAPSYQTELPTQASSASSAFSTSLPISNAPLISLASAAQPAPSSDPFQQLRRQQNSASSRASTTSLSHANTARSSGPSQQGRGQQNSASARRPSQQATQQSTAASRGPSQQRQDGTHDPRRQRSYQSPVTTTSTPGQRKSSNSKWARGPMLVTSKEALLLEKQKKKKADFDALCTVPNSDMPYPATGYYLWPKDCAVPMSLFDPALRVFDDLRRVYKCHIDWADTRHCVRINCNARDAEANVADAMLGIKVLQRNAQAQVISAHTEYFVVLPTVVKMKSIVEPGKVEEQAGSVNPVLSSFKFSGDRLSQAEQQEWGKIVEERRFEAYTVFRKHLIERTFSLRDLRTWMRMRVHIGHITLSQYQSDFRNGKFGFAAFEKMMKKPRIAAGGKFDRRLDTSTAMYLIESIISRDNDFCPRRAGIITLTEVLATPSHTEIVFVTTPNGQKFRLECEIESAYTTVKNVKGNFQIGSTRLFANNQKNKRVELTTVDLGRGFDWTLEVSQDSEIATIPSVLQNYIPSSLEKAEEAIDTLGLPYPAISLTTPYGFTVTSVVLRSTFQYMFTGSSNIVEIAIYRDWEGHYTKRAPTMSASVSILNSAWDTAMESVTHHTEPRDWDAQLHNFFEMDNSHNFNSGLRGLIHDIEDVQDSLARASQADDSIAAMHGQDSTAKGPRAVESEATMPSMDDLLIDLS